MKWVPEFVDAHQLLARGVDVPEPDLLELVQLVRVPVHGRTKVMFEDGSYLCFTLYIQASCDDILRSPCLKNFQFQMHLRIISLLLLDALSSADDGKTVEGQDTLGITFLSRFVIN